MIVPFQKQSADYMCGPAVLAMVFEYFDKKITQENLAMKLHTKQSIGTSHKAMMTTARDHGFHCREKNNATINHIQKLLDQEIPVIVNYVEPTDNDGHYAVVVNITPKNIVLNDPWNGKNFEINIKEFEKRWHNSTGLSKRWFMALWPKNVSIK